MTKLKLFGAAAAILSSALAGPAMAQEVIYNPGYCAQFYPDANCQNKGPGNPYTGSYQRRVVDRTYRDSNASWNGQRDRRYESGFWPADVAAGVVGGAVGTAASPRRRSATLPTPMIHTPITAAIPTSTMAIAAPTPTTTTAIAEDRSRAIR